jgi:PTS system nitrogen regulatory IIA component
MNPRRILTVETVVPELRGEAKEAVIGELLDTLVAARRVPDREAALKSILERERRMSTGLQNGIAIPHGKVEGLEGVVAALGLKRDGVPFASLDGQPARIILMTLSSPSRASAHIQFLAEMSRRLHDAAVCQALLEAAAPARILEALFGAAPAEG